LLFEKILSGCVNHAIVDFGQTGDRYYRELHPFSVANRQTVNATLPMPQAACHFVKGWLCLVIVGKPSAP